ncbi:MAG: NAD(P)-dependent oxidoreductase [Acidobacteriaceae bacterium]
MGRIGQAVAQRARGFGMKIHYSDPHQLPAEGRRRGISCRPLRARESEPVP